MDSPVGPMRRASSSTCDASFAGWPSSFACSSEEAIGSHTRRPSELDVAGFAHAAAQQVASSRANSFRPMASGETMAMSMMRAAGGWSLTRRGETRRA
jgi:hypothetical protein